jgi:hypothetical protein
LPFLPQTVTQIAGRTRLEAAGDPVQRHRRLGAQPFGDLTIDYDPAGNVRLRLAVGAAVEDIMLFAQAPRSAGRMKHRRVNYLGLLGPATEGQRDITAAVVARYGEPCPGQKIFAVTGQHKNGWKAPEHLTGAIVPPKPPPSDRPQTPEPQAEQPIPAEKPAFQAATA